MRKLLRFVTALIPRKKNLPPIDHAYWQDQYGTMTQNICAVLRLAQLLVTRKRIMAFTASLPLAKPDLECRQWRRKYCYRCMRKMYRRTKGTKQEQECKRLIWYFVHDFVNGSEFYKRDLMSALIGVLAGLSLDRTSEL